MNCDDVQHAVQPLHRTSESRSWRSAACIPVSHDENSPAASSSSLPSELFTARFSRPWQSNGVHGRFAADTEVAAWQRDGWALLEGIISRDEIDTAARDLAHIFPSAEEYHADPSGTRDHWLGRPPSARHSFVWP